MVPKIEPGCKLKKAKVKQALSCLRELHKKKLENAGKPNLFDENKEEPVVLHFTMKKIPKLKAFQRIRVRLPHSFLKEDADVCLITGDINKKDRKADFEETVLHYKEMLKGFGINNVTEVVPLRQLRTEYGNFEAKRQLAGQFDIFLSDNKIHQSLSRLLGNTFIKRKKFPIQLDIRTKNLKQQVDQALSGTVFYVTGRGNMCGSQIAHLGLKDIQIIKNVRAVVETLAARLPGGWKNIDTLYLQTTQSVSIPIYMSFEFEEEIEIKVAKPNKLHFLSSVNEYIRQQEEDSCSDSEEETETKKIGKKRIKAENGKRLEVKNDEESDDEEDIQDNASKLEKRQILNKYIRKLQEEFLSDDENETKRRKVEKDSDEYSEENADEVQGKKGKGRKKKTRKVENDDEANKESTDKVHEKSELSTEKKRKGKKTKTKMIVKKREDEANEESANEVMKKRKFVSSGEKIKGKKMKTKKIKMRKGFENDDARSPGIKNKKIGKRQKMIRTSANFLEAKKIKNKNTKKRA